jgi:hypothetical protein
MENAQIIKRQRQAVAMASAKWLHEIQSVIINYVTVNDAIISCMSTTSLKDEENEMFLLYFKVLDYVNEAEHQAALHPGRGHQRFGIREPNNPLPLIPVCRVYIADPHRFRTLCGLNPDEFSELLAVVKPQMLQPRNGFCEFDDQQQAQRKPRVSDNFLIFNIFYISLKFTCCLHVVMMSFIFHIYLAKGTKAATRRRAICVSVLHEMLSQQRICTNGNHIRMGTFSSRRVIPPPPSYFCA